MSPAPGPFQGPTITPHADGQLPPYSLPLFLLRFEWTCLWACGCIMHSKLRLLPLNLDPSFRPFAPSVNSASFQTKCFCGKCSLHAALGYDPTRYNIQSREIQVSGGSSSQSLTCLCLQCSRTMVHSMAPSSLLSQISLSLVPVFSPAGASLYHCSREYGRNEVKEAVSNSTVDLQVWSLVLRQQQQLGLVRKANSHPGPMASETLGLRHSPPWLQTAHQVILTPAEVLEMGGSGYGGSIFIRRNWPRRFPALQRGKILNNSVPLFSHAKCR